MGETKIDWADITINPLGWGCYGPGGSALKPNICKGCYAKRMSKGPYVPNCELCKSFSPHSHLNRLDKKIPGKRKRVFVQSMGDLFGEWVRADTIIKVIRYCEKQPEHKFMFLTQNPKRYFGFSFPANCWLGVTINGKEAGDAWPKDKVGMDGVLALPEINKPYKRNNLFLSVEPIFGGFDGHRFGDYDLIIVGAMTGPGAVRPKWAWIESIKHHNIFYKKNLKKQFKGEFEKNSLNKVKH